MNKLIKTIRRFIPIIAIEWLAIQLYQWVDTISAHPDRTHAIQGGIAVVAGVALIALIWEYTEND